MNPLQKNDEIEILIEDLSLGAGVGRYEGVVCFVEGALPGEKIKAKIVLIKKNYLKAKLLSLIEPSPDREPTPCIYYSQCDGCQYQHVNYATELKYKENHIKNIIERVSGKSPQIFNPIVPGSKTLGYRNSLTLHQSDQKQNALGFYAKDNKTIIPIEECLLANSPINDQLKHLKEKKLSKKCESLTLRTSADGAVFDDQQEHFFVINVLGRKFWVNSKGFFQTNVDVAEKIIEDIQSFLSAKNDYDFFDVYSGVGIMALLCAQNAARINSIELSQASVSALRRNFSESCNKDYKILEGLAEKEAPKAITASTNVSKVVLVNPPRAGLDPDFAQFLGGEKTIDSLIYISCDPGHLARDLKTIFSFDNYSFERIVPFDMFPRTKHVEVVAYLKAKALK